MQTSMHWCYVCVLHNGFLRKMIIMKGFILIYLWDIGNSNIYYVKNGNVYGHACIDISLFTYMYIGWKQLYTILVAIFTQVDSWPVKRSIIINGISVCLIVILHHFYDKYIHRFT